jgi:transposase-like protein
MAYSDKTMREARHCYVNDQLSLEQIALAKNIPKATLTRWKRDAKQQGDDWDRRRSASMVAGEGREIAGDYIVENFIVLFKETVEKLKADKNISPLDLAAAISKLADAFHKVMASAGRLSPELSKLGIAMEIIAKLADFTHKEFPQCGEALLMVLEPFGDWLAKNYR